MSSDLTEQRVRGDKTAEYHDNYAEDRIDDECLGLEPIPMRDCIHKEIEAARDHERSEQDLDAQQAMAGFTKVMGYTAVLGLVAGIASIFLIFLTLRATQEMARDTKVIGGAQVSASNAAILVAQDANKVAAQQFQMGFKPQLVFHLGGPYVDESAYPLNQFLENEKSRWTQIEVSIEVENIGKTPATITKFFIGTTGVGEIEFGGWQEQEAYVRLPPGKRIPLNNSIGHNGDSSIELSPTSLALVGGFHLSAENRGTFLDNMPRVFGWIEYVDQLHIKRRMGFGLESIYRSGHVKTWGADEYNYDHEIT